MSDVFLFMDESNVANYTDDTSLYACEKRLSDVQGRLEISYYVNKLKINVKGSHTQITNK